jgi:hypothetical protein
MASAILPVPATPSVAPPAAAPVSSGPSSPSTGVSRPQVTLIGHTLIMTTRASEVGRVRLSAYLGRRRLGTCVTQTAADRTFTCRLKLGKGISVDARISVWASLRVGGGVLLRQSRPAARVQEMKMTDGSGVAGVVGLWRVRWHELSGQLLCAPELAAA